MSIEALIASLIMIVVGVVLLALPLLRRSQLEQQRARESERLRLIAAYERALMTVRDLDEDFHIGKLPETQYRAERAVWVERGAAVLELLEHGQDVGHRKLRQRPAPVKEQVVEVDDPVERAIAAYINAREQSRLENAQ